MSPVRVGDIERAIAKRFPLERAEEWDRCGLLAGDPDALVTGVSLALDPTTSAIAATVGAGANVLVTHHPAFLTVPQWLTPGRGAAGVVFSALSQGVALINAHTNLDRDEMAQRLIPEKRGFGPLKPLERSLQPMSLVTVFVPRSDAERVVEAMTGAGAGRVGDYERCSFSVEGTGAFTSPLSGSPAVGTPGSRTIAEETRVEMVCPSSRVRGVVSAAAAAHPYEEPLVVAQEARTARNSARLGMVSSAADDLSLAQLAARCSRAFGVTPRVWGSPDTLITKVATATGSAGSLVGAALASGSQALVAGEVRYHDALDAVESGLAVVELGHDVTEWPLVALLEDVVRGVAGLDPGAVRLLPATPGWWTPSNSEDRRD